MANPTNPRPRRFVERTGREIWTTNGPLAYLESIQAAGAVAAPLLAGASFTLVALVLQSSTPFGRWQDVSLLFLVAAGLAQIFAVQSVIWARRYMTSPDELRQWFPDDFTHRERPTEWLRLLQRFYDERARRWARLTRAWLNTGITLLLAGIAVGVVPPGPISRVRWVVIVVAWLGVVVEASWVSAMVADERDRLGLLTRSGAITAAGGATAAAGFAVAAGAPDGAATWWATGLAVAAIPFWLAACMDASLRHGRVRVGAPLRGGMAIVRAALAPVAPAVFVLAVWSALAELAKGRRRRLRALHPGVEELLPSGVSLGAHHRAWSRCWGLPVGNSDDLAELLNESSPVLGPGGQPELVELWAKVVRSPGCVVQIVDRDGDGERFGYYAIYPLIDSAVRRLRAGQITAPGQFGPADLAVSPGTIAGWYIAIIWAPGRRWTRQCVIATLVDALAAAGAGAQGQPVFGRPVTPQGQSLMRQYGFTAVSAAAEAISVLEKCNPPR